jgi:hypothetical protein
MACNFSPNQTISTAHGYQYYQFEESLSRNITCDGSTYLRPDEAGSMLPWPYALFWLLVHIPSVIIRVVRWEKAQVLSLILASISVAISIQSYISTELTPENVLVWMPILLLLDVGAMIQVFWLLVEEEGFWPLAKTLLRKMPAVIREWNSGRHGDAVYPSHGYNRSKST